MKQQHTLLLGLLASGIMSGAAQADWALDQAKSSLHFATVKNSTAAEVHHFKTLDGKITDDGKASLNITLDSLDTANPIRDERMQKQLFETKDHPEAIVSLDLGKEGVQAGTQTISATLSLHGKQQTLSTPVFVSMNDDTVQVNSLAPIVVSATDFELGAGVETLRELAKLESINLTVPVSFQLVYTKQ